jgi:hypothetical protein
MSSPERNLDELSLRFAFKDFESLLDEPLIQIDSGSRHIPPSTVLGNNADD